VHTFEQALAVLPPALQAEVVTHWQHFSDAAARDGVSLTIAPWAALVRVWATSEFVARSCSREPQLFQQLLDSDELTATEPAKASHCAHRLAAQLADVADEPTLMTVLRRFRRWEMVRIAWRDLVGLASLSETLSALTGLADILLEAALDKIYAWHCQRFGVPQDDQGNAQQLVVLGMGKLGGGELNFSSDIDLMFTFPRKGHTDTRRGMSNEDFFRRLGQNLIKVLHEPTADGFVFRIDMRLRPFGESGPLVMHFDAFEEYYQNHGRDWERYAMIKARVCAGDHAAGEELLERLRPFIYRRYLDYSAFESLRTMKAMISREVERKSMCRNVKLGPGGIREIEFIGQAFQLIYGGREPALRQRSLLSVLDYLAAGGRLPATAVDALNQAYDFLRRVENRLQAWSDQQTHNLPSDAIAKLRLAWSMGFADWESFKQALLQHTDCVSAQFAQVFAAAPEQSTSTELDFASLWSEVPNEDNVVAYLAARNFVEPAEVWRKLQHFQSGLTYRSLSQRGRERLDKLMPLVLEAVTAVAEPTVTLERLIQLLETIARRSVYLSLLFEKPQALAQLIKLCAASVWIARHLTRHPLLLDELLDPVTLYHPPERSGLGLELQRYLEQVPADDEEQVIDALRHFQQTQMLRVAAADVSDAIPLMVVSDHLTEIAEVLLRKVLELAWADLLPRFGVPICTEDGQQREAHFAIIAYGKLGGIELNYGSDLDLVFLHDSAGQQQHTNGQRSIENAAFFAKLVKRIIHWVTTRTAAGELYEVDTRLRPSGRAGLLVSSLDAFIEYQQHQAWTWEHQALVRARVVAGSTALAEQFEAIRRDVLSRERDPIQLRREVREMRERMREELGSQESGAFHLKQDPGGIADIEFMVQYAVLAHAHRYPALLAYTDNIRQLDGLEEYGILSVTDATLLRDAYRDLRRHIHRLTLQEQPNLVPLAAVQSQREAVVRIWRQLMEETQ
jgi:glutamate-ammonia-ligase adenylyltransferase